MNWENKLKNILGLVWFQFKASKINWTEPNRFNQEIKICVNLIGV
jgi:hypothetical protein